MANDCLGHVHHGCALRVARLDADGKPSVGSDMAYVSDALVTLGFAWVVEDGEEINEKNACGATKVDFKSADNLRRGRVTLTIVVPDPELSEMLSQGSVLTASGGRTGYGAPDLGLVGDSVLSVELWAQRARDGKADPTFPYAHWAYPWTQNWRPADHEHGSGNLPMQFVADVFENELWFDGPFNDFPADSRQVFQWLPATTLPTVQCGYVAVAAS